MAKGATRVALFHTQNHRGSPAASFPLPKKQTDNV